MNSIKLIISSVLIMLLLGFSCKKSSSTAATCNFTAMATQYQTANEAMIQSYDASGTPSCATVNAVIKALDAYINCEANPSNWQAAKTKIQGQSCH